MISILSGLILSRLWSARQLQILNRTFAGAAGIISSGAVVSLNLAVSNVISHSTLELTTDLAAFWRGELLPQNLESLSLFLFGVCVAIGAYLKFGTLRDPVPEYEESDRAIRSLAARIDILNEDGPLVSQGKADQGNSRLREILTNAREQLDG